MMLRRMMAAGLIVGLAVAIFSSCGGNNNVTIQPIENGTLFTFVGDAPVSDVLSFRVTISSMNLRVAGTNSGVDVFPSTAQPLPLKRVDFCALRDFSTIIDLSTVPEGNYDLVTIGFSIGQLTLYDPTSDPPIKKLTVTLSTATPEIPIQPNLTLVKNQVNALRLDFDLLRSIRVDANGQVTGKVIPTFTATPIIATDTEGFGAFDDLVGFVQSVQPNPITTNFTGALTLQLLAGSGPAVSINFTSTTKLYGVPALNQLETGRVVEVGATMDSGGNLVADTVEAEDRAIVEANKLAFLGLVTSVTKDENGNATQFDFYVREEEPDVSTAVPLDSVVVVNVLPATTLQYSSRPTNFAPALPFDAKAIAVGQELIVNGVYTVVANQPTTVAASMIFLKLQTVQGTLGSLAQIGPDGRRGAFWLVTQASLLEGSPVLVLTSANTVYVNVLGLAEIIPQAELLVRGLPFYQTEATTINGVVVPAGTLVVKARQVHQLD
jgi:hypothetical protein